GIVDDLSKKIEVAYAGNNGMLREQLEKRRAQNEIIRYKKDLSKLAKTEETKQRRKYSCKFTCTSISGKGG
ncbi:unnamed protein product, partial [Didymodactylos carnosus]